MPLFAVAKRSIELSVIIHIVIASKQNQQLTKTSCLVCRGVAAGCGLS